MNVTCPCCLSEVPNNPLYIRERCPAINNMVYDSSEQARSCITGTIELIQCLNCGLVFNSKYDEGLVLYNKLYDNARNYSVTYCKYLDFLVELCSSWITCESIVLEIGCGKGDFLKRLSDITGCRGVGYDNAYEGETSYKNKVLFNNTYFQPQSAATKYDVIILRHVLEHIANPYEFIRSVFDSLCQRAGMRLVIEVPNLEWILNKRTFYDITYEHCNYFFRETLSTFVARQGFEIEKIIEVFDGQYLLIEGIYARRKLFNEQCASFPVVEKMFEAFCASKQKLIEHIRQMDTVCIWGASGKGVIFLSDLPKDILKKITYVVDINPLKQKKFLPVSGKRVKSPDELKHANGQLLVVIMNEIYTQEIRAKLDEIGVQATLMCAF